MNSQNITTKILSVLFILLPLLLISGSFLPDLAASLMAITYLHYYYKFENFNKKFFYKLFLLFYFTSVINSFYFDYYLSSLKSSLPYIRFLFFSIFVYILLKKNNSLEKYFFISILISLTIVMSTGLFEFIKIRFEFWKTFNSIVDNKNAVTNLINTTSRRIAGIFGDEQIMGTYLLKIFPFYLALLLSLKGIKFKNFIVFISNLVFSFCILISGDRAPLILFIFQLFLQFLFVKSLRITLLYSMLTFVFAASILVYTDPVLKSRYVESTIQSIKGTYSPDLKPKVISYEQEGHLRGAIVIAKKFPILGSGFKGYRNQCRNFIKENNNIVCTTHPHNIYFHVLSETGILGLTILLICFFYVVFLLFKNLIFEFFLKKKLFENNSVIFLIAIFITLWPFTTSGSFQSNYLSVFNYLHLGFLIFYLKK